MTTLCRKRQEDANVGPSEMMMKKKSPKKKKCPRKKKTPKKKTPVKKKQQKAAAAP